MPDALVLDADSGETPGSRSEAATPAPGWTDFSAFPASPAAPALLVVWFSNILLLLLLLPAVPAELTEALEEEGLLESLGSALGDLVALTLQIQIRELNNHEEKKINVAIKMNIYVVVLESICNSSILLHLHNGRVE